MEVEYLLLEVMVRHLQRVGFTVKDAGLLDSALSRPKTTLFGLDAYPSLELKAAAMMHSVIKNHPMMDGNKRSAWICVKAFLGINGRLLVSDSNEAFELILKIANDQVELEDVAIWLAMKCQDY